MWTNENRAWYDRSHLRYPSDLSDDEWKLVEPLSRQGKRGGDRVRVIMREVVNGQSLSAISHRAHSDVSRSSVPSQLHRSK